jgi:hypothetical protein
MAMTAQEYLDTFNAAINAGAYDSAANILKAAEGDFGPGVYDVAGVVLESNASLPPEIDFMSPQGIQSIRDYVNTTTAPPPPAVDPVAQNFLDRFNAFMGAGDFAGAANILKEGEGVYGGEVYNVASNYLNTDPRFAGLREQIGIGQEDTPAFDANNLKSFVESQAADQAKDAPTGTDGAPEGDGTVTTPTGRTIAGLPTFARQTPSALTFAPLRRGLAQLRPAMYMPGLTSGQAPLGGSGFTPESLRTASEGLSPADRAYQMDVGGVSPAELSAATGTPVGQLQAEYNQLRPSGLFGTGAPAPRGLPEDFALQTGAYGAPIATPVTLTPPTSASAPTPETSFEDQMGYLANTYLGRPLSPSELSIYRTDFGGTLNQANISDFLNRSQQEMSNRLLVGTNPDAVTANPLNSPAVMDAVSNLASKAGTNIREGGAIKMAEGGMPRLSAEEAGSTFDISEFTDDQGRLVGGYSRPIYDENRVITGYEYRPYERDVVFGEELREKEAALRPTDEELEADRLAMRVRQGRTGIDPRVGGLAAIPMYARNLGMDALQPAYRNRPSYYAKGGLADVAQDLADKGRGGDTMVAHISPQEAGLLKAMGGAGTINPETGLPEFFELFPKKGIKLNLGPLGNIKVGAKSSNILQAAAALAIGDYAGLSAGMSSLAYGGVRAAATGNLMEGIQAGLTAYGMGSTYNQFADVPIGGTAATGTGALGTSVGGVDAGAVGSQQANAQFLADKAVDPTTFNYADQAVGTQFNYPGSGSLPGITPSSIQVPASLDARTVIQPVSAANAGAPAAQAGTEAAKQGFLRETLPASVQEYTPDFLLDASGTQLAIGSTLGSSLIAGQQERGGLAAAQAEEDRKRREKIERYRQLAASTLGQVRPVREGGLMKLAGGGMTYMEAGGTTGPTGTPRDVTGTGDGMSDSVPATIEGVQEARLADGEFVIPADVVADIGNGSSDAGSKKLYDMMDRVRKARHGTTEQPPEIKAERLMPA